LLVLFAVVIILPYLIVLTTSFVGTQLHNDPLGFFYSALSIGLAILRIFTGLILLIVTARVIGLEYQLGTIRVLLSRGVGRLQLLFAKLMTVVLIALFLLVIGSLFISLMIIILVAVFSGNLNAFHALTTQFWSDTWIYTLSILVNMGVTILLATAAAVIGRSLAFGLSVALVFFPIDNIGTLIMQLAFLLTRNDFWLNITAYFLGPNLNDMAPNLVDKFGPAVGATPLYFVEPSTHQAHGILVNGTHTLIVAAVYAVIFAAIALWLTWKRDVKE